MRFSFHVNAKVLSVICIFAAAACTAHAGPLAQCIAATLSANSKILVVNELAFDDPDETHARTPRSSTFRVLSRVVEPNEGLRINGPDTYWATPLWSVVFTDNGKTPLIACPYTLVTDDGEFLILIGGSWAPSALSIYRRREHPGQRVVAPGPDHGVLIRQIDIRELLRADQIPIVITDHTPEWFTGGTFAFSDNRTLIHKTREGSTLEIALETGQVKSHSSSPQD